MTNDDPFLFVVPPPTASMSVHVPATGWAAYVEHPTTDRIIPAEVLDDPEITPSLNTLPEIRLPVPKSDVWQGLDGRPAFTVYRDGKEQPIDELTEPTDPKDAAHLVLSGQGGVELLEVIEAEFDGEERQAAAKTLIDDHTTYDSDVPEPTHPELAAETMQDVPTPDTWAEVLDIDADVPAKITGSGELELTPTGFFAEAEGNDVSASGWTEISGFQDDDDASNDAAVEPGANEDDVTFTFTTEHEIPADDVEVRWRLWFFQDNQPAFDFEFDGQTMETIGRNTLVRGQSDFDWVNASDVNDAIPDPVPAGQHTVTFSPNEDLSSGDSNRLWIDCVGVADDRYPVTWDETTDANDALEGPQLFPDEVELDGFVDATTAFAVVRGGITLTIDDTGKTQRVQLSNDRGDTWVPSDGTEDNTASLSDVAFSSASDRIRLRLRLCGYEPGTRTETPTERYDTQTVDAYELTADIEQQSLLLDFSEELSIADMLTEIVGDEFVWSYRIVDGTPTVSVVQPDARTAGSTPKAVDATVSKDLQTFEQFTVRGANKRVVSEPFQASATFQNLNNDRVIPASETVKDPDDKDAEFERGEDYEMEWGRTGSNPIAKIRAIDDGDLVTAETYEISYRHEVQGTYPADADLDADARSRTVDIPAVTSSRNAEQIAYVLVEVDGFNAPRWVADVQVPPTVATFDAIEALPVSDLDIPASAGPLEIEEPPAVTPEGVAFRLGTRPRLEAALADLREITTQVARRSG